MLNKIKIHTLLEPTCEKQKPVQNEKIVLSLESSYQQMSNHILHNMHATVFSTPPDSPKAVISQTANERAPDVPSSEDSMNNKLLNH